MNWTERQKVIEAWCRFFEFRVKTINEKKGTTVIGRKGPCSIQSSMTAIRAEFT
jgi:hypothetical protein